VISAVSGSKLKLNKQTKLLIKLKKPVTLRCICCKK
jgi:hypothetical protein